MLRARSAAVMLLVTLAVARPAVGGPFDGCEPEDAATFKTGELACRQVDAGATLGGITAFSYYVPPACTEGGCPVLYLLHGFGGNHATMLLEENGSPSAWVRALTSGPETNPHESLEPWTIDWADETPLDIVLVAPHGRTVGFGPVAGVDLFWADWNPRFANGAAYDGPPPRFETFFTGTLLPYVEAHLPVRPGRAWRAIDGVSLGGYGAYKTGLQHPDLFASIGSVSGSHNILVAPGPDPVHASLPAGVSPPAPLPYTPLPALGAQMPIESLPSQLQGFAAAFFVFGDPTFDQAWFRGNQPRDLAMNGRVFAGSTQSVSLAALNNDAIPRRPQDLGPSYPVSQSFEALVLAMNAETQIAFADQGVAAAYDVNPGLHSGVYWDPFLRERLERHADLFGDGAPPEPSRFDFRSIAKTFDVWGWSFSVLRETVEFLNLRKVSCSGLTLQGTGLVTVTVPPSCGTSLDGATKFTVDLGPPFPADEQAGASAVPAYGRTVTKDLS